MGMNDIDHLADGGKLGRPDLSLHDRVRLEQEGDADSSVDVEETTYQGDVPVVPREYVPNHALREQLAKLNLGTVKQSPTPSTTEAPVQETNVQDVHSEDDESYPLPPLSDRIKRFLDFIDQHQAEGKADDYTPTVWNPQLADLFSDVGIEVVLHEGSWREATLRMTNQAGKAYEFVMTPKEAVDLLRTNRELGQEQDVSPEIRNEYVTPIALIANKPTPEVVVEEVFPGERGYVNLGQRFGDTNITDISPREELGGGAVVPVGETQHLEDPVLQSGIEEKKNNAQFPDTIPVLTDEISERELFEHGKLVPTETIIADDAFKTTMPEMPRDEQKSAIEFQEIHPMLRGRETNEELKILNQMRGKMIALEAIATESTDPAEIERASQEYGAISDAYTKLEREISLRHDTIKSFERSFGIKREDLEEIEGFSDLSTGEKQLVLRELAQLSLGRVVDNAEERYQGAIEQERAKDSAYVGGKLMRNIWVSVRESFLKSKHIDEEQKTLTRSIKEGGVELHGEVIAQIIARIKAAQLETVITDDEEVRVNFGKRWDGIDEEGEALLRVLNDAAHQESKVSYGEKVRARDAMRTLTLRERIAQATSGLLGGDTITLEEKLGRERSGFSVRQEEAQYEHAKQLLARHMEQKGMSTRVIVEYLANVDMQVAMTSFTERSPDALRALEEIEDKNVWKEAVRSLGTERGLLMVGGSVARSVLSGALGFLAAPAVGAVVGGLRSWNRAEAEMREQDRRQRKGEKVDAETGKLIVDATAAYSKLANEGSGLMARIDMIEDEIHEVNSLGGARDEAYIRTLEQRKAKLLTMLKDRIEDTEDKYRLGLISFSADNASYEVERLLRSLAEAKVRTADIESNKRVLDRLEILRTKKETEIDNARFAKKLRSVRDGALTAGSFAFLGTMIAEYFGPEHVPSSGGVAHADTAVLGGEAVENTPDTALEEVVSQSDGVAKEIVEQSAETVSQEVVTPSLESVPLSYAVKPNDTFYGILREQVPEFTQLGKGQTQEHAMAVFLRSLSGDELRSIGVTSGNPELIRAHSDVINIDRVRELLAQKQVNGAGIIDQALRQYGSSLPVDVTPTTVASSQEGFLDMFAQYEGDAKEKLEVLFQEGTVSNYKPEFWGKAKEMTVADFIENKGLSTDERLSRDVVELEAKLRGLMLSGEEPHDGETVEGYLKRMLTEVYEKNDRLKSMSIEELRMAFAPQRAGNMA